MTMTTRLLQVDAFTNTPFFGNPAAVCLLEVDRDPAWMQSVAAEMNLSETAFVRPLERGFELRWFTPKVEVDLCGHATLAAAHAMWTEGVVSPKQPIRFQTRSGLLTASQNGKFIELNFPATPPERCEPPDGLLDALNVSATFVGKAKFDYLVEVDSASTVRSMRPDFRRLVELETRGIIVTSRSDDARFDFISRFFAPAAGIDEDPVTGSAHCALAPFWSKRINRNEMTGFQASSRGGVVRVALQGERVLLGGEAVTVFRGELL